MTPENKELLLKDLCARLPYGVILNCCNIVGEKLYTIDSNGLVNNDYDLEEVKPYLFPLSTMTEEQIKEFNSITQKCSTYIGKSILLTDFCNKHHIDWRGFIEKGLAIDATVLNIYIHTIG